MDLILISQSDKGLSKTQIYSKKRKSEHKKKFYLHSQNETDIFE